MKRVVASLVLLLTACGSSQTPTVVRLSGLVDLAVIQNDGLLFTNSSDTSELRVLDLTATPVKDYIRAPNPLEPLSIPVTERPVDLVADVHYASGVAVSGGADGTGGYLYARSATLPEISVVDATRADPGLRELYRHQAEGPVTALAPRGPAAAGAGSTLFYAVASGQDSELHRLDLPSRDTLSAQGGTQLTSALVLKLTGRRITALVVVPSGAVAGEGQNLVAIATRGAVAGQDATFVLDVESGVQTPLHFPAPVRKLLVNPLFTRPSTTGGTELFPEGRLVYGVLDEESCIQDVSPCVGVLAVDRNPKLPTGAPDAPGSVARDVTGATMLPISFGVGIIEGLALSSPNGLTLPAANQAGTIQPGVTGVGSTSDNRIFFFDAADLRPIDAVSSGPTVDALVETKADGTVVAIPEGSGPTQVTPAEGTAQSEKVFVTNQGILPGLSAVPVSGAGASAEFRVDDPVLAARVEVGDTLQLFTAGVACATELQVTSAPAPGTSLTSGGVPAACPSADTFSVRAAGAHPYVVNDEKTGYLGRTAPNTHSESGVFTFVCPSGVASCATFFHADGFNPAAPQLVLSFAMGDADPGFARDDSYVITLNANFVPELFGVDNSYPTAAGATFPGGVVTYSPAGGVPTVFVAYPSRSSIMEVPTLGIVPGVQNGANLQFHP